MRRLFTLLSILLIQLTPCGAQIPHRETVPDIRYHVSGRTALWKLSNDDTLFNVLEFDDRLQPFFQNYNPDYGHTLSVISSMKNKKGIEKELGITEHPYYVLIGPDRRILTRSNIAEDIIEYITTNLTDFIPITRIS